MDCFSKQLQVCAAAVADLHCGCKEDLQETFEAVDAKLAFDLALRVEARYFLSHHVVRKYISHTWNGNFSAATLDSGSNKHAAGGVNWHKQLVLVLLLLVQLPLLLPVAIIPWLGTERGFAKGKYYLLNSPSVKFTIAFLSDISFAGCMTFSTRERFATWFGTFLLSWSFASFVWELEQLATSGQFWSYFTDRFNRIELPAAILSLASLWCIRADVRPPPNPGPACRVLTLTLTLTLIITGGFDVCIQMWMYDVRGRICRVHVPSFARPGPAPWHFWLLTSDI